MLDEYYCLLYVPTDRKTENSLFSHLKVKDIRKFMFEVYTDELFAMIDMEEFVKSEVENKGIVVIDEIDKLVRSVRTILIRYIYNFYSLIVPVQPKQVMKEFSMIYYLY